MFDLFMKFILLIYPHKHNHEFQDTKSVVLEDLAAHFKMKAQDTIDRVTDLLEQGHITGVMDDRGKFIYISQVSR